LIIIGAIVVKCQIIPQERQRLGIVNLFSRPPPIIEQGVGGDAVCYRVVDGRAVRTRMMVDDDDGIHVEVVEGLKEEDTVIASSDAGISDGQLIAITKGAEAKRD